MPDLAAEELLPHVSLTAEDVALLRSATDADLALAGACLEIGQERAARGYAALEHLLSLLPAGTLNARGRSQRLHKIRSTVFMRPAIAHASREATACRSPNPSSRHRSGMWTTCQRRPSQCSRSSQYSEVLFAISHASVAEKASIPLSLYLSLTSWRIRRHALPFQRKRIALSSSLAQNYADSRGPGVTNAAVMLRGRSIRVRTHRLPSHHSGAAPTIRHTWRDVRDTTISWFLGSSPKRWSQCHARPRRA